jgi:large subunit ribosomal protein L30
MTKEKRVRQLKIQYYRSAIGFNEQQKLIVKGLGLRKLNAVREAEDTPAIRGMVAKVPHLVRILEQS